MRPKLKQIEYPQPLGTAARHLGLEDQKVSHRLTRVAHKAATKNHVTTTEKRYRLNLWHILMGDPAAPSRRRGQADGGGNRPNHRSAGWFL